MESTRTQPIIFAKGDRCDFCSKLASKMTQSNITKENKDLIRPVVVHCANHTKQAKMLALTIVH